MIEIVFLVAITLIQSIFNWRAFGKFLNPINIIVLWWGGWLAIALSSITNLYKPGTKVTFLVITLLLGVFSGGIHGIILSQRDKKEKNNLVNEKKFISVIVNFYRKTQFIVKSIVAFYFIKAIYTIFSRGLIGYRALTFSSEENEGVLFGNPYLEILYNITISPYIFFYLITGSYLWFKGYSKNIFISSSILLFLESSMRLGRFGLYYIIFVFAFGYLLHSRIGKSTKKKVRKGIILALTTIFLIGGIRENNFLKTFKDSILQYHTVGFTLISNELENPNSKLNTNLTYGIGTFGGLDYISTLFIRRFNRSYDSKYSKIVKDHHLGVQTGVDDYGNPIYHNAFYTILFPLYSDFRVLGVFFIPYLLSLFLAKFYLRGLNNPNIFDHFQTTLITFVFVFSIFQSIISSYIIFLAWILFMLTRKLASTKTLKC